MFWHIRCLWDVLIHSINIWAYPLDQKFNVKLYYTTITLDLKDLSMDMDGYGITTNIGQIH